MKTSRELRAGLLAIAIAWALPTASAEQAPTAPPPSYNEIRAMAQASGEAAPSLLAYRLVLRFSPTASLAIPGEAYRLAREAELAMRFGGSPQEVGLQIKRQAILATRQGPIANGMARLLREEDLRSRFPGTGFGGPERGAGIMGMGLGRLSWSAGSGLGGAAGMGGTSSSAGGSMSGSGSGAPYGGQGSGNHGGS